MSEMKPYLLEEKEAETAFSKEQGWSAHVSVALYI